MATSDEGVRFREKVTIVTGGASGIGRACVELFGRHGSKVILADIAEDLGKEVADSLNKSGMIGQVLFVKCDISNEEAVKKMIDTTVEKFKQIDCVINNAAFFLPPRTLDDITKEEFSHVLDVNVLGAFLVSKYAIKHLRSTKGNIINIASMAGVHGQEMVMAYSVSKSAINQLRKSKGNIINMASMNGVHGTGSLMAYSVSKSGLIGMTRNLAIDEAKHGVRVNCVSPAGVNTPFFQSALDKFPNSQKFKDYYANHSQYIGRLIEPIEVAKTCLYMQQTPLSLPDKTSLYLEETNWTMASNTIWSGTFKAAVNSAARRPSAEKIC